MQKPQKVSSNARGKGQKGSWPHVTDFINLPFGEIRFKASSNRAEGGLKSTFSSKPSNTGHPLAWVRLPSGFYFVKLFTPTLTSLLLPHSTSRIFVGGLPHFCLSGPKRVNLSHLNSPKPDLLHRHQGTARYRDRVMTFQRQGYQIYLYTAHLWAMRFWRLHST